MDAHPDTARFHVPGGRIKAEAIPRLVEVCRLGDGALHVVAGDVIEIHGLAEVVDLDLSSERRRPATDGGSSDSAPVGWFDRDDGLVDLGGVTEEGRVRSEVLELLTVLETDVSVTAWRSIVIHDLTPGAAEATVRVLAPMGVSFDAASPWLRSAGNA